MADNRIQTAEFSQTREEEIKVSMEAYYNWQRGAFLASRAVALVILAIAIWFMSGGEWVYQLITLMTSVFVLQSSVIAPYRFIRSAAYSDSNDFLYEQTMHFEFGDGFMESHYSDGTSSHINLNRISRVIKTSDYFILYLGSRRGFYYLPFSAFRSPEDVARLESLLSGVLVSKTTAQKRWGVVYVRK